MVTCIEIQRLDCILNRGMPYYYINNDTYSLYKKSTLSE